MLSAQLHVPAVSERQVSASLDATCELQPD